MFYAYARVSTQEQDLDIQVEALRAYWTAQSTVPVQPGINFQVGRDRGVSGATPFASRPHGSLILANMQPGDHIGVTKLDRAFRSVVDALVTIQAWDRQNVTLHVLNFAGSALSTNTPMGRFMLTMVAAFGELERGMASERTRERLAQRKAAGVVLGGVPYGYERHGAGWTPHPAEFPTLVTINAMADLGQTPSAIANTLNARGARTRKGNRWDASGVSKIVRALRQGRNPMATGIGVVAPNLFDATPTATTTWSHGVSSAPR